MWDSVATIRHKKLTNEEELGRKERRGLTGGRERRNIRVLEEGRRGGGGKGSLRGGGGSLGEFWSQIMYRADYARHP